MAKSKRTMESFTDEILDFIESLPEEDQLVFTSNLIACVVAAGRFSHIERLGMLECARLDIINNVINPSTDEEIRKITNIN